jgi:hypothetical protein
MPYLGPIALGDSVRLQIPGFAAQCRYCSRHRLFRSCAGRDPEIGFLPELHGLAKVVVD